MLDVELPDGEAAKTAAVVADCWERLGAAGFTRSDAVVTVGGGATTDVGGFVAATWLRGVRVVHVPTTLLGMVDAAVGGKTGIDTGAGKNLVGSFHEPAGVLCDLDLLATLPPAELVSGLGEVVKCGFIADPEILALVEKDPAAAVDPASDVLAELVERVGPGQGRRGRRRPARDRRRRRPPGPRGAQLRPHARRTRSRRSPATRVRHGEAVSLGMVYVAELARLAGRLDDETAARHATVLASVGLPTTWSGAPFDDLLAVMRVDKKARGRHAALRGAGRAGPAGRALRTVRRAAPSGLRGDRVTVVLVLNGPNLGRLGRRQPEIYGTTTHRELVALCEEWAQALGLEARVRQTNHEGELLDWLNEAADEAVPVVLNAAAWTHYSYALFDACAQLTAPLVEVHISDPSQRPEEFRHTSLVTPHALAVFAGHGIDGYRMALEKIAATPLPGTAFGLTHSLRSGSPATSSSPTRTR